MEELLQSVSRGEAGRTARQLPVELAEQVARALTVHFHLVNLAEERHRARSLLAAGPDADEQPDLRWPAIQAEQVDPALLQQMRLHPVVTAHPTEARRRAVTGSLRRLAHQLDRYDDPQRGSVERDVALRRLREELEVLWRTAYVRTTRPTPFDEVRTALAVFDDTLLRIVPRLYRAADAALVTSGLLVTACTGGDDGTPESQSSPIPNASAEDVVAAAALPSLETGDLSVPWQRVGTDTTTHEVSVQARTGCEQDPPVEVAETTDEVMIRVVVPEQVDPFFCVTDPTTHTVRLDAPLGTRRLVPAPVNVGP